VALAQALVSQPDVLLLDEPTNHLDLDSIQWLEQLLIDFKGSVVAITHDRAFLDRVATRIVELDRGKLRSYPGNFSLPGPKRRAAGAGGRDPGQGRQAAGAGRGLDPQGVEARRTRAQARIVRLGELRAKRQARRDAVGSVSMDVNSGAASGKLVAELTHVSKTFGERRIVDDFSATILRGDKIGLLGPNGAGKTTLLKLILGELKADPAPAHSPKPEPGHSPWGTVRQGANISVAYFDQMRNALDLDATLEDFISPGSEWIEIGGKRQHVKSYLGDFLFSPARAHSPVRSLSGGERNRLLLARLFARPANVLVLDEPTNDLDIDTLELLEDLLQKYDGTVFLVSHDRTFLDNVVTSTIAFEGEGRWREYEGGVEDWLARTAAIQNASKSGANKDPSALGTAQKDPQTAVKATPAPVKLSYKDQRELDALPGRIEALEKEQQALRDELADGAIYSRDAQRATALHARDAAIDEELMAALERWEALSSR
jgi:ATP-binding cassette subfamily F protein uup